MINKLVLLTSFVELELKRLTQIFSSEVDVVVASTLGELSHIDFNDSTTLLSFGSGEIVPEDLLSRMERTAYNLHAASPDYPGRDPHHHAIYQRSREYGATLHVMEPSVDSGAIVGVEIFSVKSEDRPDDLLKRANEAGFKLLRRLGSEIVSGEDLPALRDIGWAQKRSKRSDLVKLSEITPLIDRNEFDHRYKAFDGGAYNNLTVMIHEHLFRIDKSQAKDRSGISKYDEFTEQAFRTMLNDLKAKEYRFVGYGKPASGRHVLWRHDVDFSIHRAFRIAQIENEEGVQATYFINPRCNFYNILEAEIRDLIRLIVGLGHAVGLHFDSEFYNVSEWTYKDLCDAISREKALLESVVDEEIKAISWHDPEESNLLSFDADRINELVNVYSGSIKRDYVYSSDSNGYWRFQPMSKVIAEGHQRLHLLTHPTWWTAVPMSPAKRIDRAVLGRARKVRKRYTEVLKRAGRIDKSD